MGKEAIRLLKFAIRFRDGWHSYGKDPKMVRAIRRLVALDLIQVNGNRQFKLADGCI